MTSPDLRYLLPAALFALTGPASGQDAAETEAVPVDPPAAEALATGEAADASGPLALQEIVVTAQKREEPLQSVPVSISAFNGDQLDARGIVNAKDLGVAVPGLQFTDLAGYNLIYLRGIGTDAFVPSADPSVATYLDGIYFPSSHSIAQSFGAVQRVEVLKGPQGTLFGRNSTGGAVMLWTENPGQEALTSIQTSYGWRFDDVKTRVNTNLPLTDALAISLSGFYNQADNTYRRPSGTPNTIPQEINKGARLKIGFAPFEDVRLVLTGMRLQQHGTSTTTSANTIPSPLLGATIPAETRDYVVTANSGPSLVTDTTAYYGTLDWHLAGVDVKLLGSRYRTDAHDYVYDFDGSSQPIATYGADSDFQRITTAELQLTSNEDSWGASWLKTVGGIYYLDSRGGYDPGYLRLIDVINLPTGAVYNLLDPTRLPDPLGGVLGGILDALPAPSQLTFFFTGIIGAESYSGYLQSTASITDWLNLTAGGRYQRETRKLLQSDVGIQNLAGEPATVLPWPHEKSTVHNFSPRVSIDVTPGQDVLLYASFSQGFKSATYNIINIYTPPDYVKPERVTSYELGVKSEWLANTLRFNAAVFQNNIRDLQTGFVSFTSGGAINFENAGKARIRGVEFDLVWQPLPDFDPGLLITGGGTWLKAIYTDYESGHGYDEQTGLAFQSNCTNPVSAQCRSFDDNRIVRTPKFSGTGSISQSFEFGNSTLEIAGDYYYNSGYYYLAQNSDDSFEPRYDIINGRVSWLYRPWELRVTFFGENLGDERYNLAQFHTDFGREDTLAPPRTFGARVNWEF
ncbi:MAG TPA: TonB-dependent receptor [Nevskiaceae bacterium]|nr:TonB-dependent receptor [Nevskiaceae bacterium]